LIISLSWRLRLEEEVELEKDRDALMRCEAEAERHFPVNPSHRPQPRDNGRLQRSEEDSRAMEQIGHLQASPEHGLVPPPQSDPCPSPEGAAPGLGRHRLHCYCHNTKPRFHQAMDMKASQAGSLPAHGRSVSISGTPDGASISNWLCESLNRSLSPQAPPSRPLAHNKQHRHDRTICSWRPSATPQR
jgi:hypothetical protein